MIAALLGEFVRDVQKLVEIVAQQHLARRPFDLGQTIQRGGQLGAQLRHIGAGLLQQRARGAALLVEESPHQVHGLDVLIVAAHGKRLSVRQSALEFGGQLVHTHESIPLNPSECPLSGASAGQFNGIST